MIRLLMRKGGEKRNPSITSCPIWVLTKIKQLVLGSVSRRWETCRHKSHLFTLFTTRFNFGSRPFKFPPDDVEFRSFNSEGSLSDEQRMILPRHMRLQLQVILDRDFGRNFEMAFSHTVETGYKFAI